MFVCLFVCCFNIDAQECGTPPPDNYQTYEDSYNSQPVNTSLANSQNYCINIYFRLVRDNDGTNYNGFPASQVPLLFSTVSQYFALHNITLYNKGYDFVNNTAFNNETVPYTEPPLIPNAINIFIKRKVIHGVQVSGIAFGNTTCRVTQQSVEGLKDLLAHELGHNLNLKHTFECYHPYTPSCAEHINEDNCGSAGDNICDTPADPSPYGQSTNPTGLNYIPVNISLFHPDKTNFMTEPYTGYAQDHFTQGQGQRMRNAILNIPALQNMRSNECAVITGSNNICFNQEYVYSIEGHGNPITYSWTVNGNLQIIGSNSSNQVTIKSTNGNISNATLSVVINGVLRTKTIHIGAPTVSSNFQVVGINDWVARGSGNKGLVAPTSSTITSYKWEIIQDPYQDPVCDWANSTLPKFIGSNEMIYESNLPTAIVNWGNCRGSYNIVCTGINECGTKVLADRYVDVGDPINNPCAFNSLQFIPFPNPVISHGHLQFQIIKEPSLSPCDYIFDYENQFFNRRLDFINNQISIYDFNGNQIYSKIFKENDFIIDDIDLEPGVYVANLLTNEKIFSQQVIIVENR